MSGIPSGTVTFLLTDIENSTRLWEEHPLEMRAALARHDAIVRDSVGSHDGYVFATGGDGFGVAFQRVHEGLLAATEAQDRLSTEQWNDISLHVRMALNTGESEERDGDYFGPALNKASRLMSAGHGGQVLLSQATVEIALSDPPAGVTFEDLGLHRLKDLERPERVFQLKHPSLRAGFGPLRALEFRSSNLPGALTSFVGRQAELADIEQLFSSARLVTLTGPGGSGKTRLALETASRMSNRFGEGVWFVDLAPISRPEQVPLRIASPLGVSGEPGRPTEQVLTQYLEERELLLVIDNCEHLIDEVSHLMDGLVSAAPALNVLATSREPLGVPGETVYGVAPLPLPGDDNDIGSIDAVRLFVERARSADPDFELTEANAKAIAEVCRRLDGIPLALELAAVQLRTYGLDQLTGLLDDRFDLLQSPLRTVSARHQTLRATVDWSYGLVSPAARILFGRLSAFQGEFGLEAAVEVCGVAPLTQPDVLKLLPELVDKSLLVPIRHAGETRFRLLETLKEYAEERLGTEDANHIKDRHATYFRDLTEEAAVGLRGPQQHDWIERLSVDYDNIRESLSWAFDGGTDTGIRLASALADFWDAAGPRVEAHEWLSRAVELSDRTTPELRISARLAAADLFLSTNLSSSTQFAEQAMAEARQIGDEFAEGKALRVLALARALQEDHEGATSSGTRALQIFRKGDDPWELAWCLMRVAQADIREPHRSMERFEESILLFEEVGDRRHEAMALYSMADRSSQAGGDLDDAAMWVEKSLDLIQQNGSEHDRAHALLELGKITRRKGEREEAKKILETTLNLLRKLGDQRCTVRTLTALGLTRSESDDHVRAHRELTEGLEIARLVGELPIIQVGLAGMARLQAASRHHNEAATLYGAADSLRSDLGHPTSAQSAKRRAKRFDALRAEMGKQRFEIAWAAGEAMSPGAAIDYALTMRPAEPG